MHYYGDDAALARSQGGTEVAGGGEIGSLVAMLEMLRVATLPFVRVPFLWGRGHIERFRGIGRLRTANRNESA